MNRHVSNRDISIPENWDRRGLPGWTYHSDAFLELEKQEIFRKHWQIACHVSDLPEPGDYIAFDMCGERALIIRGNDGEVRAFHNMCRHRGARVVADEHGSCKGALVCPFHGWVYNLDGTLRGAARPKSFPDLDKVEFGLQPLEAEVWNGFVFVRFEKGPQSSVAELFQPFAEEIAHFNIADMVPTGE
ncbi:MAG: Rieske (2Fe-2S) protein, partial [Hoeflea sp.]|nr:Rieske (2Fe-2S) protein [Hoeflea sp.]